MDSQLIHNMGAMRDDGFWRNAKGVRDFLGSLSFRHQFHDLPLPRREPVQQFGVMSSAAGLFRAGRRIDVRRTDVGFYR